MGQEWSCFGLWGKKNRNKSTTTNDTKKNGQFPTISGEKSGFTKIPPLLDEFDPNAQPKKDLQPAVQKAPTFDISECEVELPPYSLKAQNTPEQQRAIRWHALPDQVQKQLLLWRKAHQLRIHGHNGAFEPYIHRHTHVWLDSAHTLGPVTRTAILLYAAMPLLIGKAKKCNMTFFFTTFPNVDSPEVNDKERLTLKALIEVFNCSTYRAARDVIKVRQSNLDGEGMQEFVDDEKNFEADDDAKQRLIKLLRYTRQQMQKYWYGWEVEDLNFAILKQLYKIAIRESEKQPKLQNNTAFVYRREIGNYKRLQKKKGADSYEITCTFLLATPLTPAEVKDIQKYQEAGAQLIRASRNAKAASKISALRKKGAREGADSSAEADVAQELEKQGHPFCIEGIVFKDSLGQQAQDGYTAVDTWLDGTPEDINDVTFASESDFIRYLLHEYWIFKTTCSHDPRVDDWPELLQTPQYNLELLADGVMQIQVANVALVLEFVFDILPEDAKTGDGELDILEQLRRQAGLSKTVEGIPDVPNSQAPPSEPASVNAGAGDQKAPLEKDPRGSIKPKHATVEDAPSETADDPLSDF